MMHSSANKVRLPGIEDIEKYHGEYVEEVIEEEEIEEVEKIDVEAMLREAHEECNKIIEEGRTIADAIVKKAKEDAEALKHSQAKLGYKDGRDKGQKEMDALIEEQKAEFAREVQAVKSYRDQMFDSVKKHIVECLQILCKKIIFREFKDDDFIINTMIDHYYYMIKDRSNIVLSVSREDYAKLDMKKLENRAIKVKVEETFSHGDLTISCDAEGINFGLSDQVEKAQKSIGV